MVTADRPIATVESSDFGSAGPIIPFTPPLSHTLIKDNIHKKGMFEKMNLADVRRSASASRAAATCTATRK
jgi:hypothetical protein